MANLSTFSVALTAELNDLVQEAVATGEYDTGSDVIREALMEWQIRRALRQSERSELQLLWAEGLESGPGRHATMGDIKREARRRRDARLPSD